MNEKMLCEVNFLGKGNVAVLIRTLIRFLLRVSSQMIKEVTPFSKIFITSRVFTQKNLIFPLGKWMNEGIHFEGSSCWNRLLSVFEIREIEIDASG